LSIGDTALQQLPQAVQSMAFQTLSDIPNTKRSTAAELSLGWCFRKFLKSKASPVRASAICGNFEGSSIGY